MFNIKKKTKKMNYYYTLQKHKIGVRNDMKNKTPH